MVTAYTFPKPDPLVDPFGNRQITYQTDRGRVLSSTAVLSASFGDVFSDTAQQNGVVNVTRNQYDGLRPPNPDDAAGRWRASYTYATTLRCVGQQCGAGDADRQAEFAALAVATGFACDPLCDTPTSVTDPHGLVTTMRYVIRSPGTLLR